MPMTAARLLALLADHLERHPSAASKPVTISTLNRGAYHTDTVDRCFILPDDEEDRGMIITTY